MSAFDLDLFGNERPTKRGKRAEAPVALSLLDHAAERNALATARPVSQERAEIVAPNTAPDAPGGTCATHGTPLLLEGGGKHRFSCPLCG